ncbi:BH3-interacting domain death agonist [Bagarius yarrelli]|uniref:BH3-interacting domain death agonist n=1 Tax=Bagarius yarrelli TaxID=175774 RepID=A0A556V6V1_BAGYA|nr:BH3-interacting domain death agonist [Bagarius yarrelli]
MMDVHSVPQTPLLFLTFLQQSPGLNCELQREVDKLHSEVKLRSVSSGGFREYIDYPRCYSFDSNIECDGELQTDGHSLYLGQLHDVPQVELVLPVPGEAQAVREMAEELIRMADEFNQRIVSQAAEHLTRTLSNSSTEHWSSCLSHGIEGLLNDVPGVHTERIVMALTFSLVKAVCERAPRFLRGLCNTVTQTFTFNTRPR